jgi:DNA-binding NarL/FixJ family response regulator
MLVEDHPVVRHGVRSLLAYEEGISVVAEASNGDDAIALHAQHRPDVTLVDLRLPGKGGVEVIEAVRAGAPGARFIVLTTYDTDQSIHAAIRAGAQAYVLKDSFVDEIVNAVRTVHAGGKVIPKGVAERLAESVTQVPLSPRELEVLRLVARGDSNKEIAAALDITEGTVKTFLVRLFGKLGVTDRTAAVTVAIQRGIINM